MQYLNLAEKSITYWKDGMYKITKVKKFMPNSGYKSVSAYCPAGYTISGGGFYKYSGMDIRSSRPEYLYSSGYSWTVVAFNNTDYTQYVYCYAQCIKLGP